MTSLRDCGCPLELGSGWRWGAVVCRNLQKFGDPFILFLDFSSAVNKIYEYLHFGSRVRFSNPGPGMIVRIPRPPLWASFSDLETSLFPLGRL